MNRPGACGVRAYWKAQRQRRGAVRVGGVELWAGRPPRLWRHVDYRIGHPARLRFLARQTRISPLAEDNAITADPDETPNSERMRAMPDRLGRVPAIRRGPAR